MPARTNRRKDYPLSMRLPPTDIALIDRACHVRGRSRTEFVRDAAVREAQEAIIGDVLIRMSPTGFAAFANAVAQPGKPAPELVRLFERKPPWVKTRTK